MEDNRSVVVAITIRLVLSAILGAGVCLALTPEAKSAKAKLALIMQNKARRGATIVFTAREMEEWAKVEVPEVVPDGFRQPRVELGTGTANGYALLDFKRLRHAQGGAPSWLDNLIDGERPVKVSIALESAKGWCTVRLTRLEISRVAATGRVLDLLVKTFFLSLYPNAKINEPFELDYRIDHLQIKPSGLYVTIKR